MNIERMVAQAEEKQIAAVAAAAAAKKQAEEEALAVAAKKKADAEAAAAKRKADAEAVAAQRKADYDAKLRPALDAFEWGHWEAGMKLLAPLRRSPTKPVAESANKLFAELKKEAEGWKAEADKEAASDPLKAHDLYAKVAAAFPTDPLGQAAEGAKRRLAGTKAVGAELAARKAYDAKFAHVASKDVCFECHDQHSLKVRVTDCATCHVDRNGEPIVTATPATDEEYEAAIEKLHDVRMAGTINDFNGNGDTREGVYFELTGLRDKLYDAIRAYANTPKTNAAGQAVAAQSAQVGDPRATVEAPVIHLRGLDNLNGTVADVDMAVGETTRFGHLEITAEDCRVPRAEPEADAFAFLKIRDIREENPRFSGWMFASSPALSALDHPRYDVWVIGCDFKG